MISIQLVMLLMVFNLERPTLTVAQGIVESGLNPYAIGKVQEKGAWQIREHIWGKVPKNIINQASHHEKIMNELIENKKGNIFKAISSYNGKGKKSKYYAKLVCKKAFELHVLRI